MMKPQGFIFISSPDAVTPYHFDPEHNILLQLFDEGRLTDAAGEVTAVLGACNFTPANWRSNQHLDVWLRAQGVTADEVARALRAENAALKAEQLFSTSCRNISIIIARISSSPPRRSRICTRSRTNGLLIFTPGSSLHGYGLIFCN